MSHRYIMFYKPFGYLSQFTGEKDQNTLESFNLPPEVYAAGRLDKDSEGLLILTDDGPFIKQFLDPDSGHERTYLVQVEKIPQQEEIDKLEEGVVIKGRKTRPCKVKLLAGEPDLPPRNPPIRERKNIPTSWLQITLIEGKNRQVRRMTASIGFPTLRLVRVSMGKLKLQDLEPGKWKEIKKTQIL